MIKTLMTAQYMESTKTSQLQKCRRSASRAGSANGRDENRLATASNLLDTAMSAFQSQHQQQQQQQHALNGSLTAANVVGRGVRSPSTVDPHLMDVDEWREHRCHHDHGEECDHGPGEPSFHDVIIPYSQKFTILDL